MQLPGSLFDVRGERTPRDCRTATRPGMLWSHYTFRGSLEMRTCTNGQMHYLGLCGLLGSSSGGRALTRSLGSGTGTKGEQGSGALCAPQVGASATSCSTELRLQDRQTDRHRPLGEHGQNCTNWHVLNQERWRFASKPGKKKTLGEMGGSKPSGR